MTIAALLVITVISALMLPTATQASVIGEPVTVVNLSDEVVALVPSGTNATSYSFASMDWRSVTPLGKTPTTLELVMSSTSPRAATDTSLIDTISVTSRDSLAPTVALPYVAIFNRDYAASFVSETKMNTVTFGPDRAATAGTGNNEQQTRAITSTAADVSLGSVVADITTNGLGQGDFVQLTRAVRPLSGAGGAAFLVDTINSTVTATDGVFGPSPSWTIITAPVTASGSDSSQLTRAVTAHLGQFGLSAFVATTMTINPVTGTAI